MKPNKIVINILLVCIFSSNYLYGQIADSTTIKLKNAAMDIIKSSKLCALITIDKDGRPVARMMDAFSPDSNFVVWLGTNPKSRKVKEIKINSAVCLYYSTPSIPGYVMIQGTAKLVNDLKEKNNIWKPGWEQFYKSREKDYILIKVIPSRLEVINYKLGVTGDPVTWDVPFIKF